MGTGGRGASGPRHTRILLPPQLLWPLSPAQGHTLAALFPESSAQASSYHRTLGLEGPRGPLPVPHSPEEAGDCPLSEGRDLTLLLHINPVQLNWGPRVTAAPQGSANEELLRMIGHQRRKQDDGGSSTLTPSRAPKRFSFHPSLSASCWLSTYYGLGVGATVTNASGLGSQTTDLQTLHHCVFPA